MPDAWDILPDKKRVADSTATFIIFCEGDVTEPCYFKAFEKAGKLKVNTIPDQKQGSAHLNNVLAHCLDLELTEIKEGAHQIKNGVTKHLWCAYDRDMEHENLSLINAANDFDFTNSIKTAQVTGLKVAWSNDAFELWILLHFEDIPVGNRLHRRYIYDRLTEIFRNLTNPPPDLLKKTANPNFGYKETMKSRNNFMLYVKPLLDSRRVDAIKRAKALETSYSDDIAFHDRNPCTMVHHLVESLLSFQ